jgi:hypothetical protein
MTPRATKGWRTIARTLISIGGLGFAWTFVTLWFFIAYYSVKRPQVPRPGRGWAVGLTRIHPTTYGTAEEEHRLLRLHGSCGLWLALAQPPASPPVETRKKGRDFPAAASHKGLFTKHPGALIGYAFQTWDEQTAINRLDRTRLRLVNGNGDFLNVRPDHRPVDRGHNQDRKGRPSRRCWFSMFLSRVRRT